MMLILKALTKIVHPVFVSLSNTTRPENERLLGKCGVEIARWFELKRLLKRRGFDLAIISRPTVADRTLGMIRRLSPRTRIIFDTVDIVFRRLDREYELTGDRQLEAQSMKYRKLESQLARSCDQVWVVTPADQAALQSLAPTARFEIIPTIHPLNDRGRPFAERNGLVFIGNFLHRPNGDAVRYFVDEILPALRRLLPGVSLSVIGGNVPPEVSKLESADVRILGFVENVEPLFHSARVFVAPLRFGAGMKGKIGQALSFGLPVVTTSIGAEGMGFTDGDQVMIADSPSKFAEAVTQVYSDCDTWQRLADSGYLHIEKNFSPSAVEERLFAAIRNAIEND
jgi:glycosyltransferase involved in cell wall biosynthesis